MTTKVALGAVVMRVPSVTGSRSEPAGSDRDGRLGDRGRRPGHRRDSEIGKIGVMKASRHSFLAFQSGSPAMRFARRKSMPKRVRDACARVPSSPIQKAQAPWYTTNKQVCASCHHQYQPALAYRAARDHRRAAGRGDRPGGCDQGVRLLRHRQGGSVHLRHRAGGGRCLPDGGGECRRREAESRRGHLRAPADLAPERATAIGTDFTSGRPPRTAASRWRRLGCAPCSCITTPVQKAQADAAVARARTFLEGRTPRDTEERSYQLLGLRWAGADAADAAEAGARPARRRSARRRLELGQRARQRRLFDRRRRWSRCTTAAASRSSTLSYQRGIAYLLKTQAADGTWHVTSRLHPPAPLSPPYFDAGLSQRPRSVPLDAGCELGGDGAFVCAGAGAPGRTAGAARDEPAGVEPWVETDDLRHAWPTCGSCSTVASARTPRRSPAGRRRLMMAAPDVEKMTLLLDRGADVNARAPTAASRR